MPVQGHRHYRGKAPGPESRYVEGNLLIQQVRSTIGRSPAQRAALVALKLGKIGRSATCDVTKDAVRHQLAQVGFMIAVAPLTLDAATFAEESASGELDELAPGGSGQRRTFVATDGEYAYHEPDGEGQIIWMWSSGLPAATVLGRAAELDWRPSRGESVIVERSRSVKMGGEDAWDQLIKGPVKARFTRLNLTHDVMVWASASYPKHVDQGFWPGRVGLRCDASEGGGERVEKLIEATATPRVGANAPRLIASISESDGQS